VDWQAVEVAATIAAFAAPIGWGVYELRRRNVEDLDERVAELLGVTLTYELHMPRPSEAREGAGIFIYRLQCITRGRLPITEVIAEMTYPGLVRRVHSD
jgi:hypothetical protein